MKKKAIRGLIAIFCLGGVCFIHTSSEDTAISHLAFENIEALAHNEGDLNYVCYGTGSIDCHGEKVEKMKSGFSLR